MNPALFKLNSKIMAKGYPSLTNAEKKQYDELRLEIGLAPAQETILTYRKQVFGGIAPDRVNEDEEQIRQRFAKERRKTESLEKREAREAAHKAKKVARQEARSGGRRGRPRKVK